jgi:hypothetical protein
MDKKLIYLFFISSVLGISTFFIGKEKYISNYLFNSRGLCASGGNGIIQTFGLYNCYTIADKYLIMASYVFGTIAVATFILIFLNLISKKFGT